MNKTTRDFILLILTGLFTAIALGAVILSIVSLVEGRFGFAIAWLALTIISGSFAVGSYHDATSPLQGGK